MKRKDRWVIFYKGKIILVGDETLQRPDRSMGVVRARADVSMEELIPPHGDKRKDGVLINEGRSLVANLEPMIEVSHK